MHKGGGVRTYAKGNISFSVCYEFTIMEEKFFKLIFIKAIFGGKSIICGEISRYPNPEANTNDISLLNLDNCLSKIPPSSNCVIGGDFNYNLLKLEDKFVNRLTVETVCMKMFFVP